MTVAVVSHFHWDREWYRTMQAFRARLVDAVDRALDLAEADPGYRFLLDGQTVILEDYLAVRPDRRDDLARHVAAGRLGIGPWYVQPDSLLPSGESHVRNLLAGRRVGEPFGPVSKVAYVPDSFGHPAQFPQLFAGFGLDGFVYWRGNGDELDRLGARWRWAAPDGSTVRALLLAEGYFCASRLDDTITEGASRLDDTITEGASRLDDTIAEGRDRGLDEATTRLAKVVSKLRHAGEEPPILMNGFDHTRPDRHVAPAVDRLADMLAEPVERRLLDEVVATLPSGDDWPLYRGDLVGGRLANLLPGVWSARLPLKLADRRCTIALERWAEPWAALGRALGLPDERPALRLAWQSLLLNQAHDSICGCSTDGTHDRMLARYHDAESLADETTRRVLERLAGRDDDREVPWQEAQRITVFNPSPHPRTDRVRVALDAHPALPLRSGEPALHPLVVAGLEDRGFAVDGRPARVISSPDPARLRWLPDQRTFDVEFVAVDVPAFGCRTYELEPVDAAPDQTDDGTEIAADGVSVGVDPDGTLRVTIGDHHWTGLFAVDDVGDRGDSYDADLLGQPEQLQPADVRVVRRRHPSGLQQLTVSRTFTLPAALADDRTRRSSDTVDCELTVIARVTPSVERVDTTVRLHNRARDHRLRLRFPTGTPTPTFLAATTFDAVERRPGPPAIESWVHPPVPTFCQQGWVALGGLAVAAPGLPEAEVHADGTLALTLVRAVGWLARFDLASRPLPAGPCMPVEGAQCLDLIETDVHLLAAPDLDAEGPRPGAGAIAAAVLDASAGLRGVIGGPEPRLADGRSLLAVEGEGLVLSAVKPAEDGEGMVVRVLNPTDEQATATLTLGVPVSEAIAVRLDETPVETPVEAGADTVTFPVPAHALRSVRLLPGT